MTLTRILLLLAPGALMCITVIGLSGIEHWTAGFGSTADARIMLGRFGIALPYAAAAVIGIVVLFAGGQEALIDMRGGPEDDGAAAREAVVALAPTPRDCLIAVTASGQTPYPLAAVEAARQAGAHTIGIANNRGAPLFDLVEVGICLETPPEVIAGSTRMGAGTAQKIALNMLSTLMAIRLGHVHDGFMVNVVADNAKLRMKIPFGWSCRSNQRYGPLPPCAPLGED